MKFSNFSFIFNSSDKMNVFNFLTVKINLRNFLEILKNISIETLLPFQPKGRKSNKAHFSEASSRKNELHLFSLIFNLNFINFF